MVSNLKPGRGGEPLPPGENTMRLAELTDQGGLSETTFTLSSSERASDRPWLSVWASKLTTPTQMWRLGGAKAQDTHYVTLGVGIIRAASEVAPDAVAPIDVVWDPIEEAYRDEPGGLGHAGISGLDERSCPSRRQRRAIRSRLKDAAEPTLASLGR